MKFRTHHLVLLFICIFINLYVANAYPTNSVEIEKRGILKKIKKTVSKAGNGVKNAASTVGKGVKNAASTVGNGVKDAASTVGNGVKNAASTVGNGVKDAASTVGNGVKDAASTVGNGVKGAASTVGNGVKNAASTVGNGVKDVASTVGDKAKDVVEVAVSSIIHNLNDFAVKLGIDTAKLGAMILDMKKDSNGIYHADFDCWQSKFGYNKFFDFIFDLGTSMDYNNNGMFSYNGENYILWAWKGDYINLGAGAELGIYYGGSSKNSHWKVKKSLAMPMTLTLTHKTKGTIVNQWDNWGKDAWWITAFNPKYRNVKAGDLTAIFTVKFTNTDMYKAFENTKSKGWKFDNSKNIATLVI